MHQCRPPIKVKEKISVISSNKIANTAIKAIVVNFCMNIASAKNNLSPNQTNFNFMNITVSGQRSWTLICTTIISVALL